MSHFSTHFSWKSAYFLYFRHFLWKFGKKSAIFVQNLPAPVLLFLKLAEDTCHMWKSTFANKNWPKIGGTSEIFYHKMDGNVLLPKYLVRSGPYVRENQGFLGREKSRNMWDSIGFEVKIE